MAGKRGKVGGWNVLGMMIDGDLLRQHLAPLPCLPGQIQVFLRLPGTVRFPFAMACQGMWGTRGW